MGDTGVHVRVRLREKEHLFHYQAWFEGNLLQFVCARPRVCANDTKLCTVEMRNAVLKSHLTSETQNFEFGIPMLTSNQILM